MSPAKPGDGVVNAAELDEVRNDDEVERVDVVDGGRDGAHEARCAATARMKRAPWQRKSVLATSSSPSRSHSSGNELFVLGSSSKMRRKTRMPSCWWSTRDSRAQSASSTARSSAVSSSSCRAPSRGIDGSRRCADAHDSTTTSFSDAPLSTDSDLRRSPFVDDSTQPISAVTSLLTVALIISQQVHGAASNYPLSSALPVLTQPCSCWTETANVPAGNNPWDLHKSDEKVWITLPSPEYIELLANTKTHDSSQMHQDLRI